MKLADIDGTVDEVDARHPATPGRAAQYAAVDVIDPHGVTTTLARVRAEPEIAAHIHVGAAGRFYVYNVAGFRGIHGFRPVNGAPVHAFPRSPAWICLGIAIANLAWIGWRANGGGGLSLFSLAPFMLACLLYAVLRRAAGDAAARVSNDTRPVVIPGQPAPNSRPPAENAPAVN